MFRKILLATDGSEHSFRAADKAIYLAQMDAESHIVVFYVVDSETAKKDVLRSLNTKVIADNRMKMIAPVISKAKEAGVSYEVKIVHGEPGPTIVKYANDNNFDIVLIGSRGLNLLQEFVLGSVSHKVAKRAKCPVMIVK